VRLRLSLIVILAPILQAQNLKEFEKKVTEFTLPNGLHIILAERHEAPVVSFHTYVNAGSVDDPTGQTGLAHMFEHMAFKGTETIGTKNWAGEKKALDAIEEVYDRLDAERNKGPKADEGTLGMLELKLKMAIDQAQTFVEPNEYTRIIEESGGAGLNAGTDLDSTEYYYSLPSNRIELWFLMESQRFLHPVFREFYKERDVVMEEHRMRVESNPQGKLQQNFLTTAFAAHPYHNPPGGWPSDIASLRRSHAKAFFDTYYVPSNVTIAIVGDVNPVDAKRMAERYFGPWAARPLPPLVHTKEPAQSGPKRAVVESASQPIELVGYKRPDQYDKDDATFDVIQLILSNGRTGMMYKELVQEKQIALAAQAIGNYPGSRYPNLFTFVLVPSLGHTVQENEKALDELLVRFTSKPVDATALARAKKQARAGVIRRLANNAGLAALLTSYAVNYGDWKKLFTSLDDLNKVTANDVQRVALHYFVPNSRTNAYTEQPARGDDAPGPGGRP
jgi:predicted Zn-dependent peptidase